MKPTILIFFTFIFLLTFNASAERIIKLKTSKGEIVLKLYNETPKHRDNFIKLIKQKYYDSILFHRVIKDFMIQAGDPESKRAAKDQRLGSGDVGYKIPAEFYPQLFHKRGVLAAARDNNPEKASSGNQFYIVQGKVFTDSSLNEVEIRRLGGRKIPEVHREVYKTLGGAPHLDSNYTVFGEVVKGMGVVDAIAGVERDAFDRPKEDIRIIKMRISRKLLFF
ncbi:MAG: peptidylprolyl isomerase [Chitinophagaceae bacterium]